MDQQLAMALNGSAQAAIQQPQTVQVPVETPVTWNLNIAEAQWMLGQMSSAQQLNGMPLMQVAVLIQRLQAMTQQAVNDFINPPPKVGQQELLPHSSKFDELRKDLGDLRDIAIEAAAEALDSQRLPEPFDAAAKALAHDRDQIDLDYLNAVQKQRWPHQWHQITSYGDAQAALKGAEGARREPLGSLDVSPAKNPEEDYAAAGMAITSGLQHLDEALPGGQRQRTLHAYAALRWGVWKLGQYLDIHLPIENTRGRSL